MGDSPSRGRKLSTRTRSIIFGVLAVFALAAVILGVGALTAPKRPDASLPPVEQQPSQTKLYDDAVAALASGDTTRATTLLRKAAEAGSEPARKKLEQLSQADQQGTQSISLTSAAGQQPSRPSGGTDIDAGYTGARELLALLPTTVKGLNGANAEVTGTGALRPFEAARGSAYDGRVSRVVLTVLDEGTISKAQAYVDGLPKAYPKQVKSVTVGVVPRGKSGNDGQKSASVVFKRGRYVFEVVITTTTGTGADIQPLALEIAKAFPASR